MSLIVDFHFDVSFHSEVSGMCPHFMAEELLLDIHALISLFGILIFIISMTCIFWNLFVMLDREKPNKADQDGKG